MLQKETERVKEIVIAHRRKIHAFAEIGGKEFRTHDYICSYIEKLGLPYDTVAETAVIAVLDTGKEEPAAGRYWRLYLKRKLIQCGRFMCMQRWNLDALVYVPGPV